MNNLYLALINEGADGTSVLVSIVIALCSILVVFLILYIIILCIKAMEKIIAKVESKKGVVEETLPKTEEVQKSVEIVDEDMMVAALIATIDYTNETKKDVRLKSIKRIG